MKIALFILLALTMGQEKEITMSGIKVHDKASILNDLALKLQSSEKTPSSQNFCYLEKNGNEFNIVTKEGQIVYLEQRWSRKKSGKEAPLGGFTFGKTTVADVRKAMKNDGFLFVRHKLEHTETYLRSFLCYELDSPNQEVLVVVGRIPVTEGAKQDLDESHFMLDALILADIEYLEYIWEEEKVFNKDYQKVKLPD